MHVSHSLQAPQLRQRAASAAHRVVAVLVDEAMPHLGEARSPLRRRCQLTLALRRHREALQCDHLGARELPIISLLGRDTAGQRRHDVLCGRPPAADGRGDRPLLGGEVTAGEDERVSETGEGPTVLRLTTRWAG